MPFIADKQTTDDLNLLGKYTPHSIFSIFCKVKTGGGERLLEHMFKNPLNDAEAINRRSSLFSSLQDLKLTFPVDPQTFRLAADYLGGSARRGFLPVALSVMKKKFAAAFLRDEGYDILLNGVRATVELILKMRDFAASFPNDHNNPWFEKTAQLGQILYNKKLRWLNESLPPSPAVWQVARLDHLLRHVLAEEMDNLLQCIYELDVFIAVSDAARERNFSYAHALPAGNELKASACWHPALEKAVSNTVHLHRNGNVLFLTGANMAGKSTFMKSIGIAVYLAHMGFPVAAKEMAFSVRDGLYSSINVSDNLNMGYSHFYAEVLRVKQAAAAVSSGSNWIVIFDELFKGTNVKDAYDATLAVTTAFSKYRNCLFVVSTHIIEVGEALREQANIQFAFMPTIIDGHKPTYTYTLTPGITSDRHGMMIIQNEGIIEMIEQSAGVVAEG